MKKKKIEKSKKKWAGGSGKFYSRGGKKVEKKVRERTRLLSKDEK